MAQYGYGGTPPKPTTKTTVTYPDYYTYYMKTKGKTPFTSYTGSKGTSQINPTTVYTREQLSGGTGSSKASTPSTTYTSVPSSKSTSSGGGTSKVSFPTYSLPKISLNVPSFTWNPTEEQKAGWLSEAEKQAALIVDPQKAAELESLERYKAEVQSQIGEINPRMTQMSIAMANTVQNTIKQEIINELIRRGATTSGEMERQLGAAGRYEVEQRTAIENERNRLLNELAKQQMAREEEYGTRVGELEKIRGLETAVRASELERQAREYEFARQQALFEAELARAQLQNAVAAAKYDAEYKKKLLEADLAQQAWERQYNEQQLALEQQYRNWQMRPQPAATPEYLITGTPDWLRAQMWKSGYYTDPLTLLNQYLDNLPVVNNVASALAGRVSGGAGGRLY